MTKQCSKCKEVKPLIDFYKNKSTNDGYRCRCKKCHKSDQSKWRENNKQYCSNYDKQYKNKNKERIASYSKRYYELHKEDILKRTKEWGKEYRELNWERIKAYRRKHDTPSQQWRWSKEARAWRQAIYEKHNHTCQHCNKTHCRVHAHHIKPAKDHPDLRYDIDNGVCLCEDCHKKAHS